MLERVWPSATRIPLPGPSLRRLLILVPTGVFLLIAAYEFVGLWRWIDEQHAIGLDFAFYKGVGDHWLDTGQLYLAHQLSGHYIVQTEVDVLYPPVALLLFVPFHWLPFWLWWVVPGAVVAYALWRFKPVPWSWPVLAFLVFYPKTISATIYGNSDIWITGLIAAGTLWAWPSVLVLMKPSLLPFAFIGARRRSWWIAAALLGLANLPFLGMWADYATVMHNSSVAWYYSLANFPMFCIPVVAWLARRPAASGASVPASAATGPAGASAGT